MGEGRGLSSGLPAHTRIHFTIKFCLTTLFSFNPLLFSSLVRCRYYTMIAAPHSCIMELFMQENLAITNESSGNIPRCSHEKGLRNEGISFKTSIVKRKILNPWRPIVRRGCMLAIPSFFPWNSAGLIYNKSRSYAVPLPPLMGP